LSVLDLAPIVEGSDAAAALRHTLDLARHAEARGYHRYWLAEHHNMDGVACSATAVLVGHVAGGTQTIRVGSGGVMLPNHAPLRVAEAFRTLAALYPGRIDLGLGRAPGSDPRTSQVLRAVDGEHFPELLSELLVWSGQDALPADHPLRSLQAMPDDAPLPPVWLLGSSGASARMAGAAGMGYSFASHFSPTPAAPAFEAYRSAFVPSRDFAQPHAILGVSVLCAPTDDEAETLASGMDLAWARLRSGVLAPLPSPEEAARHAYTDAQKRLVRDFRRLVVIGTPETVRRELLHRAAACEASELMIVCNVHSHAARLRSYELVAQALAD
jgi:luciferase family oxidoreductase group 1